MLEEKVLPYSYHTFLFPFIWKTNSTVTKEEFYKALDLNTWKECIWTDIMKRENHRDDSPEWFQNYQAYQYYTESANNAIFNTRGDKVVQCYEYNHHDGHYIISKEDIEYQLNINKIRLNVYQAGIAILVFELENQNYKTLDHVNAINEYGRRINMPYLVGKGVFHSLCADRIELKFRDKSITENFRHIMDNIHDNIRNKKISITGVMQPIQYLLDGGKNSITANPESENMFYIKPATDDRMFVCCMVMDSELSKDIQGIGKDDLSYLSDIDIRLPAPNDNGEVVDIKGNSHADYMEGWSDPETISSRLYRFLYVETDLTCESNPMKKDLLMTSVYNRWINSGTLYGVTHHSFMAINSGAKVIIPSVINPFLTIYVQMAILALAQRSVILMLEDEASKVSNGFSEDGTITKKELIEIETLQVKYVKIQNQLLLSEITVQEQGVDLYKMLREQLYLEKNMMDLDSEMKNLRDIASTANAQLERKKAETKEKHDKDMLKSQQSQEKALENQQKAVEEFNQKKEKADDRRFELLAMVLGLISIFEPLAMGITLADNELKNEGWLWFGLSILALFVSILLYHNAKRNNNANQNNNQSP